MGGDEVDRGGQKGAGVVEGGEAIGGAEVAGDVDGDEEEVGLVGVDGAAGVPKQCLVDHHLRGEQVAAAPRVRQPVLVVPRRELIYIYLRKGSRGRLPRLDEGWRIGVGREKRFEELKIAKVRKRETADGVGLSGRILIATNSILRFRSSVPPSPTLFEKASDLEFGGFVSFDYLIVSWSVFGFQSLACDSFV
ncbi:hypothetical protein BHE74_00025785 [Ensete ventricosum]|nr:hypothetical protein BHE74_00025785 [Ensete ventricosum]